MSFLAADMALSKQDRLTCLRDGKDAAETVRALRARLEEHRRRLARRAGWTRRAIPTGLAPLDALLPDGGLPRGSVAEILSGGPGVGAMSLAMRIAARMANDATGGADPADAGFPPVTGRAIVVVDTNGDFYPPAAVFFGVDLDRLIVVRTVDERKAAWAADQSLRCPAVAAVVAPFRKLDERLSRRLQLAAESSGSVGLILRPAHPREKSFAAVRISVEGVNPADAGANTPQGTSVGPPTRLCRLTLLKVREGMPASPVLVDLCHETGACAVHPVPDGRSAAKLA